MTIRAAACHCGRLQLRCEGTPLKISMCHCLDCQRRTGSAFSVAVFYRREQVAVIDGISKTYERDSVSEHPVRFHFCGHCGSNVYWEPERLPDLIGVAIGAFADPEFPPPEQSVFMRDKHRWLDLPAEMASHDLNPPPRA